MTPLSRDALKIWQAGVAAVGSEQLVHSAVKYDCDNIEFGDFRIRASNVDRVLVVGAGKAGTGMAAALEEIFGPDFGSSQRLEGWVNVPAGCERSLEFLHLHPARPQGVNEPTEAGCEGTRRMLEMVGSAGPNDLCVCVLSGGGSALMPAPIAGICLDDKVAVTRHLSASGANIDQLNTVRKQLSDIKGGGLLRACRAGRLVTLIISDVLGDPLDVIASGPTVSNTTGPGDAIDVLEKFGARETGIASNVFEVLKAGVEKPIAPPPDCETHNLIIGNNSTAVEAAASMAASLGYAVEQESAAASEGLVESVADVLCNWAVDCLQKGGRHCLVSGGEPAVRLAPEPIRGKGGRNQQLVLATMQRLAENSLTKGDLAKGDLVKGVVVLSGGTDGEDGPTDAAGAIADAEIMASARQQGLDVADYLRRNDAYHFFQPLGALIQTGPTHTNVGDVRVVIVDA